jgi:hypothetical protein
MPTQHNTTQHNTTQHNTTQHNTTQHNTTQHSSEACASVLAELTSVAFNYQEAIDSRKTKAWRTAAAVAVVANGGRCVFVMRRTVHVPFSAKRL